MTIENLFDDTSHLDALMRDIKHTIDHRQVEFTDEGVMLLGRFPLRIGGVFTIGGARYESVQRAIDDGDPEREAWFRKYPNGGGRFTFGVQETLNRMPTAARNFVLNLSLGTAIKKTTWYLAAFSSNSTPDDTWDANWAGASGNKATEVGASQVTATSRLAGAFGSASGSAIDMTANVTYVVKTGVTGVDAYGGTLNSSSAFGYNTAYDGANGHVLYAAALRPNPLLGLAATDEISLKYRNFAAAL